MRRPAHLIILGLFLLIAAFLSPRVIARKLQTVAQPVQQGQSTVEPRDGMYLPDRPYPDYEPNPGTNLNLGENHAYTVTFRGNGEAVVVGKYTFTNTDDQPTYVYRLRIPRVDPDDMRIFQQMRRGGCIRFEKLSPRYDAYDTCNSYQTVEECNAAGYQCGWYYCANRCLTRGTPTENVCPQPKCATYQEFNYYDPYWSGATEYKELDFEQFGDELEITLSGPLTPQRSASIIIYYRAFGYAKKVLFGVYKYKFETLTTPQTINALTVAIETDSDLYLKGVKGKTNYRIAEGIAQLRLPNAQSMEGAMGAQLDSYYQKIGQGETTKSTGNLSGGESYTVSGVYADAVYKLYLKEIFLGILAAVIFILIVAALIRVIIRRLKTPAPATQKQLKAGVLTPHTSLLNFLTCAGLGFTSSVFIFTTFVAYYFFSRYPIFQLYYYDYWLVQSLFQLIFLLIIILIDLVAFLSPIVYVWRKKGAGWALATLACTIIWLIAFSTFLLLIVLLLNQNHVIPPYTRPYMM